jgi:hypothetical protein
MRLVPQHAIVGQPCQDLLDHAAELGAGQIRAETAVGAQAESRVPVREAVELDLLRVLEGVGIVVGGAPADEHAVARAELLTAQLHVSGGRARQRLDRREVAQELLACTGPSAGSPPTMPSG